MPGYTHLDVDDPEQLYIIHLILIPMIQAGHDWLCRIRSYRFIQGSKGGRRTGGQPRLRARAHPRPADLHHPLPVEATVEEWARGYVADGFGNLTRVAESKRSEHVLARHFQGAFVCRCVYIFLFFLTL